MASVRSKAADPGRVHPGEPPISLPAVSAGIPDVPGECRPPRAEDGQLCRRRWAPARGFWCSGGLTGTGDPVAPPHRRAEPRTPAGCVYATRGGDRVPHLASWGVRTAVGAPAAGPETDGVHAGLLHRGAVRDG